MDGRDDLTPQTNKEYATREYWEQRYQKYSLSTVIEHRAGTNASLWRWHRDKGLYDWFKGWAEIEPHILPLLKPEHRILHVGCGNSEMGERLYDRGFKHVVNMDFSAQVIDDMKQRYADKPELECMCHSIERASVYALSMNQSMVLKHCGVWLAAQGM